MLRFIDLCICPRPNAWHRHMLLVFIASAFLLAAEDKLKTAITASSVTDIYYLLHKPLHDANQAKQVLLKLFSLFEVFDVTRSDCEKALSMPMSDYEDALLTTLDLIITRNLTDFAQSPVKAIAPDDFLANFF